MDVTLTDPGDSPSNKTKEQLNDAAWMIIQRFSERVYNTVVTDENSCSSYKMWKRINRTYAISTPYTTTKVLNRWNTITFLDNLAGYLDKFESFLKQFSAIGFKQTEK